MHAQIIFDDQSKYENKNAYIYYYYSVISERN